MFISYLAFKHCAVRGMHACAMHAADPCYQQCIAIRACLDSTVRCIKSTSVLPHGQPLPLCYHVELSKTGLQLPARTLPGRLSSCQQDQAGALGCSHACNRVCVLGQPRRSRQLLRKDKLLLDLYFCGMSGKQQVGNLICHLPLSTSVSDSFMLHVCGCCLCGLCCNRLTIIASP